MAGFVYPSTMLKAEYAVENCPACGLHRNSRLQLFGQGKKKILLLFDKQESIQQVSHSYGVGDKYDFVKDVLNGYNIYPDEDCWITSAIQCFGNTVDLKHAECCKPALIKTINMLKPELIIAFGEYLPKVILKPLMGNVSVEQVHGFIHNSRDLNCNIMFTYAPHSKVGGKRADGVDDLIIKRDIHNAVKALETPRKTWSNEAGCVHTLNNESAVQWLENAINDKTPRFMAFDYETNCLRPFNRDSKVLCVSIADGVDNVVSFMLNATTIPPFQKWLRTDHIIKIAHNSAFERQWSMVKLGVDPHRLIIDTMLMAHALDNRDVGWLSIKFLAPLLTGCNLWNSQVDNYIQPQKQDKELHGSYALNKMEEVPQRQLLLYCGIDSLVEYRVGIILNKMLKDFYKGFCDD